MFAATFCAPSRPASALERGLHRGLPVWLAGKRRADTDASTVPFLSGSAQRGGRRVFGIADRLADGSLSDGRRGDMSQLAFGISRTAPED
eukprot:COSAG06_NODE_19387_length_840_cov_9.140351_1_plen_89_part_10